VHFVAIVRQGPSWLAKSENLKLSGLVLEFCSNPARNVNISKTNQKVEYEIISDEIRQ
jgi:hypothetical protein